jgi:hypothetical protein
LQAIHVRERAKAGGGLDAPHTRSDATLRQNLERTDVAGALHVRATAQLERISDA